MNAEDLMTPRPATLTPRSTVREALDMMRDLDVRHVPVIDPKGQLVGMISDRDLRVYEIEQRGLDRTLVRLMSADVISVQRGEDLTEVIDLMIEHKVGAVPVVEPGDGDVVGIVSYIDVLREARDRLEA